MIGFAVFFFVVGALLIFFALQPKLSFFLDEGWKFKGKTEPSELYVGANVARRLLGGLVAICLGVIALGAHFTDQKSADAKAAADAAHQRCEDELLPRFDDTIEWDGPLVSNSNDLRLLAKDLGVDVEIERETGTNADISFDRVSVMDPNMPGNSKLAVTFYGATRIAGGPPTKCNAYMPEPR